MEMVVKLTIWGGACPWLVCTDLELREARKAASLPGTIIHSACAQPQKLHLPLVQGPPLNFNISKQVVLLSNVSVLSRGPADLDLGSLAVSSKFGL